MSVKKDTVTGMKWLIGSSVLQRIIALLTTAVLARMLGPSTYGLFAYAMIVVTSFELFKSLGIDAALLRRDKDFALAADTTFWIIPFLGISLYILLFISAPLIGRFLNSEVLVDVVKVLGIIFVLNCFGRVPNIVLDKKMQFHSIAIAEFISKIMFSITAIVLAFLGWGIWSLVYAYIIQSAIRIFYICKKSGWAPTYKFDFKLALEMLNFGKFIFFTTILWFIKMNLDNILVGKLLGTTMLGFYAISFNVANFGADFFGSKIYRVMYPAYARLRSEGKSLKPAFFKITRFITLIALPFAVTVLLLSREMLYFVYGEKWLQASECLRILAFAGFFNAASTGIGGVYLAEGKPKYSFFVTALQVGLFFLFIIPFARKFGLEGVSIVVSLVGAITFFMSMRWVKKVLKFKAKEIINEIKPIVISVIVMSILISVFKLMLWVSIDNKFFHINFIVLGLLSMFVYFRVLKLLKKDMLKELLELVKI